MTSYTYDEAGNDNGSITIGNFHPVVPDRKAFPCLNANQYDDVVDAYKYDMVETGGLKFLCTVGSCMTSHKEIRPTKQSTYPRDVYVDHLLFKMELYSLS